MQSSAVYDHRSASTPSQTHAASQRAERLRRIGSQGRPDTPISLRPTRPVVVEIPNQPAVPPADPDALFALWVERQRQKHAEAIAQFEARAALETRRPPVELIQKIVANYYGLDWRIMHCASRTIDLVRPRQIAMYLSKVMSGRSFPDIGRRFGGRDHSTVVHAVHKIKSLMAEDECLAADIEELKSRVEARTP